MLDSAAIDGLKALRPDAMAAAPAGQREQASCTGLGFGERLGLLVDRELTARASRRMDRCLKAARLRSPAAVEDIDFRHPRGLDRAQILSLAQAHWASNRRAIVGAASPLTASRNVGSGSAPILRCCASSMSLSSSKVCRTFSRKNSVTAISSRRKLRANAQK